MKMEKLKKIGGIMQLIHGDCLEKMKDIPDKSIDMILCDYASGLSLRSVATKYNTNHHRIKRILTENGVSIRQPKNTRGLRKYETLKGAICDSCIVYLLNSNISTVKYLRNMYISKKG